MVIATRGPRAYGWLRDLRPSIREIPQQGRHFIYSVVKLLIGDGYRRNVFRLPYKNQRRLVPVLFQMTIHAVVAGIELASGIPLPERSVTGVERGVPVLVPTQEISIFAITFGKILFAEALVNGGIGQVGLPDKFCVRINTYCSSFQWTAICASLTSVSCSFLSLRERQP